MFKKLFGKKDERVTTVELMAPLTGNAVKLETVPDPVFAEKMMGDGLAIEPRGGEVVSPCEGEVIQVFPTKHAIGLRAKNNAEVLIHIGLETVSLNGEGFTVHVKEGDKVKTGDKLVTFDLEFIRTNAKSTVTPIIVTNSDQASVFNAKAVGRVESGRTAFIEVTISE